MSDDSVQLAPCAAEVRVLSGGLGQRGGLPAADAVGGGAPRRGGAGLGEGHAQRPASSGLRISARRSARMLYSDLLWDPFARSVGDFCLLSTLTLAPIRFC